MWKPVKSRVTRYLPPLGAIIAALLTQAAIAHVVPRGFDFPYAFFYLIAVFAVTWFGGYIPGAIACLLTVAGLPMVMDHSYRLRDINLGWLVLFLGFALMIGKVSRWQQLTREKLSGANEELEKRSQDLAQAIEGLESEIARHRKSEEKLQTQLGRMHLLDQITRAIGERQDLRSIFQVVVRTLEDSLPLDFCCVCLYNADAETLTVNYVGVRSAALATEIALTENTTIALDPNGLARCVDGHLVYEPDNSLSHLPFKKRLF